MYGDNMNYKKIFKRETKLIVYVVICMTILVIGTSYALFLQVDNNSNNQVVEAGSLSVTYSGGNSISVDDTNQTNCLMPQNDTKGSGSGGCSFRMSITNKGTLPMEYNLLIYDNASGTPKGATLVDHSLIRHSLKKQYTVAGKSETVTSAASIESLDSYNANKKILEKAIIESGETITFSLNVWIDENASSEIIGQYVNLKLDVSGSVYSPGKICKRATELHKEKCTGSSTSVTGCYGSGYYNQQIEFGSLGTKGTLKVGDAFDCDVNGDGNYDSATERFYYVSDYYNTETKSFETEYATMIYYTNTYQATANNNSPVAYDNSGASYYGPRKAATYLPTTSQWKNVTLKTTTRNINDGSNASTYYTGYSYNGYAARFLTEQEVVKECNNSVIESKCNFLLENTNYTNNNVLGKYWLETASPSGTLGADIISGAYGTKITSESLTSSTTVGVRPAIDVAKANIDY